MPQTPHETNNTVPTDPLALGTAPKVPTKLIKNPLGLETQIPKTEPATKYPTPADQSESIEAIQSIEVKAFLDTIAWAEIGTADASGYQTLVFGKQFQDFSNRPKTKQCATVNGRKICSTAAGRYQILYETWNDLATKLGLNDFSPDSQDTAAIALIDEKGALEDVEDGRFEEAVSKVSNIWASLPGNNYNQNPKSIEELRDVYDQFIEFYYSLGQSSQIN